MCMVMIAIIYINENVCYLISNQATKLMKWTLTCEIDISTLIAHMLLLTAHVLPLIAHVLASLA